MSRTLFASVVAVLFALAAALTLAQDPPQGWTAYATASCIADADGSPIQRAKPLIEYSWSIYSERFDWWTYGVQS